MGAVHFGNAPASHQQTANDVVPLSTLILYGPNPKVFAVTTYRAHIQI